MRTIAVFVVLALAGWLYFSVASQPTPSTVAQAPVAAQAAQPTAAPAPPTAVPPTAVPPTAVPAKPAVAPTLVLVPTSVPAPAVQPTPAPAQAAAPAPAPAPAPQATAQGVNPLYGTNPQPQVGHPSLYLETGVPCPDRVTGQQCNAVDAHTKHYVITIEPGMVGIVGGFIVDGVMNGVYKAVSGTQMDTTVTDGFVLVTKEEWANQEFCFRIGEANKYNWVHATERPLAGWKSCS